MSETVSGEELEKINGYAREPLTEDKVFVFRVALCDNDIDRDGEKVFIRRFGEACGAF